MPSSKRRLNIVMIAAAVIAFVVPLSLSFWILTILSYDPKSSPPSPIRWLASIGIPVLVIIWSIIRKSLDISGAIAAFVIGFVLTLSNYCFLTCLFVFFITSSKATNYKKSIKKRYDAEFKEGGQRNWVQVICNGGVATEMAILYMIERGIAGEIPINFERDYYASWFAMAVLGALSCANGDTWASELGSVLTEDNPRLITDLRVVPRGTNGGITVAGVIVSAFGGLTIGLSYYLTLLLCINRDVLSTSPSQLPVILTGALSGLLGSLIDSYLGATLQYSGLDRRTGKIVETPGDHVEYISGSRLLDNHSVNLLSTLLTALLAPTISACF